MLRKSLIMTIFDLAYMQRWNDKIRPMEFTELDKQAHKMCIAYLLGKYEELNGNRINWIKIIEGGFFELLKRTVITDIKPQIYSMIKKDKEKYEKFNEFVFNNLKSKISCLGNSFVERFREYLFKPEDDINYKILKASHVFASKWEFDIIKPLNLSCYDTEQINNDLMSELNKYNSLKGIDEIINKGNEAIRFISLCGYLRFQLRWSNLHRIPKTSVLGHTIFVAYLSYLFSLEIDACDKRKYNNFFTGLFHDLPESLTRDIISPVKKSVEGLEDLIKDYENEELKKYIYPVLPDFINTEIKFFTENEFEDIVIIDGKEKKINHNTMNNYNEDKYNPRDGTLVKMADEFAAFIEATVAIENGSLSKEFQKAKWYIKNKYENLGIVSGINIGELFTDFY